MLSTVNKSKYISSQLLLIYIYVKKNYYKF